MKYISENKQYIIIDEAEDCHLQESTTASRISLADFSKEDNIFYSTTDRLLFTNPTEVISKVLSANNFQINLENILACLDQMKISIAAKNVEKGLLQSKIKVDEHQTAIMFKMPSKQRVGALLTLFYQEIETYEMELAKFKGKASESTEGKNKKTYDELKKENDQLKLEVQGLVEQVRDLNKKVHQAQKEQNITAQAIEAGQLLPPQIRIAKVKSINNEERSIQLKMNRKTLNLSFDLLHSLPLVETSCLVKLNDGTVEGAYFFEDSGTPFQRSIGTILYANSLQVKIRDENRTQHIITAANSKEEEKFATFKRGEKIIIEKINENIIRIESCRSYDTTLFSRRIQENIVMHQLGAVSIAESETIVFPHNKKKKEVA